MEKLLETLEKGTQLRIWFGGAVNNHVQGLLVAFIPGSNWEGPVLEMKTGEGVANTFVYVRKAVTIELLS